MIAAAKPDRPRRPCTRATAAEPLRRPVRFELTRTLLEKGYAVSSIRAGGQCRRRHGHGVLDRARAVRRAERRVSASADDGTVQVHFRDIARPGRRRRCWRSSNRFAAKRSLPKPGGWKPWFPVIDYGRCTNCMQCLSFCLFDVYGVSTDGKIQVQNENNCKTDCPACSRVCPEVAILFPKYRSGPINGDEINPDDLRREAMKVDISALLGGDIYQALRDRSDKAKSRSPRSATRTAPEGTPALPDEAAGADGHPAGSAGVAAVDRSDSGQGRAGQGPGRRGA